MKTALITALLTFIMLTANAQKMKIDKVDDMTGRHYKQTSSKWIKSSLKEAVSVYVSKIDSFRYINFTYESGSPFGITSKLPIRIKLSNDTVISFTIKDPQVGVRGGSGKPMSNTYGVIIDLLLSKAEYELMLKYGVVKVRLQLFDCYTEFEVDDDKQKFIKDALKLIQ